VTESIALSFFSEFKITSEIANITSNIYIWFFKIINSKCLTYAKNDELKRVKNNPFLIQIVRRNDGVITNGEINSAFC
jgi:hypothetical protein